MAKAFAQVGHHAAKPRWTAQHWEATSSLLTAFLIAGALVYGWVHRGDPAIRPGYGVGYALGIVGGSMMLLLLVYPFRKRIPVLSAIGSVGFWFRFHMLLGLLGPLLILYHARYSWGALNSAVAMGAMLIVAGSGLIGRFLYARVHRGYSGRKIEMRSLMNEMHLMLDELSQLGSGGMAVKDRLEPFEHRAVEAASGFWTSARAVVGLGISTRQAHYRVQHDIRALPAPPGIPAATMRVTRSRMAAQSTEFLKSVRRAAEFAFYDRMLRLWHLLHLPLFFILMGTAIIHVVAVHMY